MAERFEELYEFARETVSSYEEKSRLDSITNLSKYNKDLHSHREFVEIGKRSNLPKHFFGAESTVTISISQSFADAVATGEVVSILDAIEENVENGNLDKFDVGDFNFQEVIIESFDHVYDPDMIFLPNSKELRMELMEWSKNGRVLWEEGNQYIMGSSKILVNWMPSSWGFQDAYIFNRNDIDVVQKQYKDVSPPDYINRVQDFDGAMGDDKLMIYLGSQFKDRPDEYELIVRSVISKPRFTGRMPKSAVKVDISSAISDLNSE